MATLRGLANVNNPRVSEAADDPAYGHVMTHTRAESYEAPKRRNSEERVTKERTVQMAGRCIDIARLHLERSFPAKLATSLAIDVVPGIYRLAAGQGPRRQLFC